MTAPSHPGLIDLVMFDFDGTLCDSVDVKTRAFYELYLDDEGPDLAAAVRDHHLSAVGASRYDKIRHVERHLLGRPLDEERVEQRARRFGRLVEDAVVAAPLFDGVMEFLEQRPAGTRFTVVSATPADELRRIVERKGIAGFFAAVDGAPRTKSSIAREHVERFSEHPHGAVVVGDQPSDAAAARAASVEAVLITRPAPWTAPFERVDDFAEAAALLTPRMTRRS